MAVLDASTVGFASLLSVGFYGIGSLFVTIGIGHSIHQQPIKPGLQQPLKPIITGANNIGGPTRVFGSNLTNLTNINNNSYYWQTTKLFLILYT